jgi:hypothetical protein
MLRIPTNRSVNGLTEANGIETAMLHGLIVVGGFALIGVAAYGFWQGLKLKPHDNIPPSKGSRWRT